MIVWFYRKKILFSTYSLSLAIFSTNFLSTLSFSLKSSFFFFIYFRSLCFVISRAKQTCKRLFNSFIYKYKNLLIHNNWIAFSWLFSSVFSSFNCLFIVSLKFFRSSISSIPNNLSKNVYIFLYVYLNSLSFFKS